MIHHTDIITDDKYAILKAGERVEFIQVKSDRGYKAKQCVVVEIPTTAPVLSLCDAARGVILPMSGKQRGIVK